MQRGGGVSGVKFSEKSVTKVYGSKLFSVTRGWVGVEYPGKKLLRNTRMAPYKS